VPKPNGPVDDWQAGAGPQRVVFAPVVLEEADGITDSSQADALHERAFGLIDDFIDPTRLETAGDLDFH
jgi:hypothetical protein